MRHTSVLTTQTLHKHGCYRHLHTGNSTLSVSQSASQSIPAPSLPKHRAFTKKGTELFPSVFLTRLLSKSIVCLSTRRWSPSSRASIAVRTNKKTNKTRTAPTQQPGQRSRCRHQATSWTENFLFSKTVQTGSGAQTDPHSMGTGVLSRECSG